MKRDRKGEETERDTLIQNVRQHKNHCVRVCVYEEFLNSDTCMYTQWRSCAFRFIVVSASWHTPHSSMSNTSYCFVQLSFMTAIFAVGERRTGPNRFPGSRSLTHFLLVTCSRF